MNCVVEKPRGARPSQGVVAAQALITQSAMERCDERTGFSWAAHTRQSAAIKQAFVRRSLASRTRQRSALHLCNRN